VTIDYNYGHINCKMLPKVTHMVIDTVPLVLNGTSWSHSMKGSMYML